MRQVILNAGLNCKGRNEWRRLSEDVLANRRTHACVAASSGKREALSACELMPHPSSVVRQKTLKEGLNTRLQVRIDGAIDDVSETQHAIRIWKRVSVCALPPCPVVAALS